MKKLSKIILPLIFSVIIIIMYFTHFTSTNEIGSFTKFSPGSEINQEIIVVIVKSKGFEKDTKGNIVSFYAEDKNGVEARVSFHEPLPKNIINAEVVEILGHMHGNNLVASRVLIVN
jgi:cytochrome c-type biogenesis protein CcmE